MALRRNSSVRELRFTGIALAVSLLTELRQPEWFNLVFTEAASPDG
jgi:hypothetical protein